MPKECPQTLESAPLRYASLCSGIEAVTLAWRPLGLAPAWFSEIDPFASAVLRHHYPDVANLGDMTQIAPRILRGEVCAPEMLVGGTPCQSFSIAGLRKGLTDPRGALTLKYVELANAIDQVRSSEDLAPAILVWENVPGVLSDATNAFGCFLGALSGEAHQLRPAGSRWTHAGCVYGPQRAIAWRVLDAQHFGLAQRRKRVFAVASARADFDPSAILFEPDGLRGHPAPGYPARKSAPPATGARLESNGGQPESSTPEDPRQAAPETTARADKTLSVCFGGGNARGPIERAVCLTARGHKCDFKFETFAVQALSGAITHTLNTANGGKGSSEDGTGRGTPVVAVTHPLTCSSAVTEDGNGRGVPIVSGAYRNDPHHRPDEFELGFSVAFAQNSRGELRLEGGQGQLTGALSTGGGIPGQGFPVVASVPAEGEPQNGPSTFEAHLECRPAEQTGATWTWRVRRLMPLECERLQGLPDHYTQVPYRGKPAADGPRYKVIGNSMAVPCVAWIGRRLIRALRQAGDAQRASGS